MNGALNIPTTLSGRYRLERELGRGAMGYVYLARDLKHGRHVAVKVLASEAAQSLDAERFLAEVRTAAGLNHPHILTVHESGEADGRLYYVMPRVEGPSLKDLLEREPRLPLAQAVDIARQVAEGLSYAHARGVVHRDIKPGNILIDATGHVYIADFGLAFARSSVSSVRRTAAGTSVGSPLYMSPEQAAGEEEVDARSDIYSLGCVLFEMLAGGPPFQGQGAREVMRRHITAPPPSLRSRRADVPPMLDAAIQKALAKDPADRYATAGAFCQELKQHALDASGSGRHGVVEPGRTGAATSTPAGASVEAGDAGLVAAFTRLRRKREVPWLLVYLAAGLLLLLGGHAVAGGAAGPAPALRAALLLFGAGAIVFALTPWLLHRRGAPPVRGVDAAMLGAFSLFAILSAGIIVAAGWGEARGAGDHVAVEAGGRGGDELDPRRIAVLYFDERSPGESSDYLAAGLTEALIDALTGVAELEVLSKHAVAPYRDRSVPLAEIVNTLQAGTIVSGTVRQAGDAVQVGIQLVEGATGTQRWSTAFERSRGEVLAVRDQLVDEVARALRERLGYEFEVRRTRRGASSDAAWRLVREGDELLRRQSVQRLQVEDVEAASRFVRRADSLYAAAARLDSTWLEPLVRRAEVAELDSRLDRPAPDRRNRQHLERGIALTTALLGRDSAYAPALEMRGRLRYHLAENTTGDPARRLLASARTDLERAVELQPSLASGWWNLSRVLWRQGWFAEASTAAERALEADAFLELPQQILFQLYNTAFARERLDDAIRWCDLGRQRHPGAQHFVLCRLYLLASVDSLDPSVDRGWSLADSLTALADEDRRSAFATMGQLQAAKIAVRAGLPDSARAVLRRIADAHDGVPAFASYDAAHARLLLGDRDEALRLLRRWVDYQGPQVAESLARDWWFRPLYQDPGFQALVGGPGPDG